MQRSQAGGVKSRDAGCANRRSRIRLAVLRNLLMGLQSSEVPKRFCRTASVMRLWRAVNTGGIEDLTKKGMSGRGRREKAERLPFS